MFDGPNASDPAVRAAYPRITIMVAKWLKQRVGLRYWISKRILMVRGGAGSLAFFPRSSALACLRAVWGCLARMLSLQTLPPHGLQVFDGAIDVLGMLGCIGFSLVASEYVQEVRDQKRQGTLKKEG